MDYHISRWIYETFGNSEIFANIAKIFTLLGNKWAIIAIAFLLLCFKKTRKLGLYVTIACGFTYVLNDYILKSIFDRSRPFIDNENYEKLSILANLSLPDGSSMPSGHAAVAMALAIMVFMFNHKYGVFSIIIALFVGFSRVALCVHYMSDVMLGFVVGIICSVFIYYVVNLLVSALNHSKQILVFASNNKHKLNEVRQILSGFEILSLNDIGFNVEIEENGKTLEENAKIKAYAISNYCKEKNINYPIFSDDSGLFINALKGAPGVKSARYAKSHDDEANRQKVLKNLKNKKDKSAYFECVIYFVDGEKERVFSGKTEGYILHEYKGDTSFGYDCIFMSNDLNKSFGEASKEEKDSVSHRGRAVEQLKKYLTKK